MKKQTAALLLIGALMLPGCAGMRANVMDTRIADITPKGCYWSADQQFFICQDKKQEEYLRANSLTQEEIGELGSLVYIDSDKVITLFMRLHDCVGKPQDDSIICTYQITKEGVWKMNSGNIRTDEAEENGKHIYTFSERRK